MKAEKGVVGNVGDSFFNSGASTSEGLCCQNVEGTLFSLLMAKFS